MPRTFETMTSMRTLSVTHFCRTETTACPEGIQSLNELLGKGLMNNVLKMQSKSSGKSKKRNVKQQDKKK